jgi:pyridoxine kinase
VLPTAILSTHTGGFEGYTFQDLTESLPAILKHWAAQDENFDLIYSGYLGSKQ